MLIGKKLIAAQTALVVFQKVKNAEQIGTKILAFSTVFLLRARIIITNDGLQHAKRDIQIFA